jgi:hypothetical protein
MVDTAQSLVGFVDLAIEQGCHARFNAGWQPSRHKDFGFA